MKVWHDILEGIGLSVIILVVVIGILYYDSAPKHAEVTATKKIYHEDSDSTTMEFENKQGDKIYSIDDYVCPLGTKATIYYDRRTGELLEIVTRTTLKESLTNCKLSVIINVSNERERK